MKFELDHRTGMMRPKKDEEIYFAQSQGGGLIVDDKKNNIKYVIQRDGRITKLFGSFDKDNLNLYDMRDARIIADRVRRLLGVDHKYTDFHYFLRGYHMNESVIESCSDFLNESIWSDIQDRSGGESVRKEDEIDNLSQDDLCDYLKSKYKPSNQNTDIEFDKKYNIIYVPVCRFAGQAITGVLLEELGTSKRVTSTLSINYFTQPLVDELEKHFQIENVPKIPGKRMALMKISPKDGTEVTNSFFIKVIDFFLNVTVKDYGYDESGQDLKKILKKVNESIWSDIQDRSAGETVRAEDIIIDNKTIKSKIKQLYIEQGEDDTLDVSSLKIYKCDDLSNLFYNFNRVKQIIGLETWDVSNVTDMRDMFNDCQNLTELNISNWDVSNVTNMNGMFIDCSSLTELNISNWDVSNVTDMAGMFSGCSSLIELNISTWDVSNVIDMYCMFKDCSSFTELNIDNWDVGNVTDMRFMFEKCESLTELNISNWNVSNATNMAYMFGYCKSLTELNISNWDVSKVTNMNSMFTDCSSLKELNIDTWDVSKVTYMRSMFNYCDKLIKPKWYKDE